MSKPTLAQSSMPVIDLRGVSMEDRKVVEQILTDLFAAGEQIRRAGVKWCRLSEETREKVLEGVPAHWREFLGRLQRVGEGRLHPQLYAAGGRVARTLGHLPIAEQERYLSQKIPVAVERNGKPDTLLMDVSDMGEQQINQVFETLPNRGRRVRSISEQRQWLADARAKAAAKRITASTMLSVRRPGRWTIEKGKAFVDPAKVKSGLTRPDLVQMLKDMSQ